MKYTDEQIRWLKENCESYNSYRTIRNDFNKRFDTAKSVQAIQQYLTKVLKVHLVTPKTSYHFTTEEENWLKNNYSQFDTYTDLAKEFNHVFNRTKSTDAIREKCSKYLQLKGMPNPTIYKKGNIKEQCPIGTIRRSVTGTYIKVKDDMYSHISGYAEPYWLPIQKKIWQDHYGEVPEGKMVIFLDGDHENLDIDNLYCIDRRISIIMAKNHWYTDSREHTLTAIKYCELHYALKDQNKSSVLR